MEWKIKKNTPHCHCQHSKKRITSKVPWNTFLREIYIFMQVKKYGKCYNMEKTINREYSMEKIITLEK